MTALTKAVLFKNGLSDYTGPIYGISDDDDMLDEEFCQVRKENDDFRYIPIVAWTSKTSRPENLVVDISVENQVTMDLISLQALFNVTGMHLFAEASPTTNGDYAVTLYGWDAGSNFPSECWIVPGGPENNPQAYVQRLYLAWVMFFGIDTKEQGPNTLPNLFEDLCRASGLDLSDVDTWALGTPE